jgi:transaldolase
LSKFVQREEKEGTMLELWIEGTPEEVVEAANSGLAAAIATNPSIMERWTSAGQPMEELVAYVCEQVDVPVYVQLHGPTVDDFLREMDALRIISDKIHPKLVATHAGIAATKRIAAQGLKPLVTTISTLNQAFLSAAANAAYVAPYVGRIDDAGVDAYQLIRDIAALYERHGAVTQIAAASIRTPEQCEAVLRAGAPIVVMQYGVFQALLESDMTADWIDRFEANWQKIPHSLMEKG